LNISSDGKDGKEKTQRFVLGTDGLWDVMSNHAVGKAAARKASKSSSHHNSKQKDDEQLNDRNSHNDSNHGLDGKMGGAETPKQAASRIMEQCLKNGGNQDDITICVVDVSYQ
jgi:serine/threonine protein phosphatase PrpC